MNSRLVIAFLTIVFATVSSVSFYEEHIKQNWFRSGSREIKEKCPKVKAIRNFDLVGFLGFWYVVQYYASSEEAPVYGCMRSMFTMEDNHVSMNFTYVFEEDPIKELIQGNLTWFVPNANVPGHWMHTEDIYEGIYNTYVIDTDYKQWGLIMHCAEKTKSERYLSALLLSREPVLGMNVINFLREKLPRYDIDTSFMFPIDQENCKVTEKVSDDQMKLFEYISELHQYEESRN
ncbi:hypothetical protein Bhyg_11705 [Pseudolycoriella hygida]|uniref:VDE lipocalin domain-containing protein n=1 Tax=Pseudolycoriella hygida TaxID=35572 RepID=A0A9Q0MYG3_9DIPT|nr:hypothetical protein Bhyg_11705 [Pseudolycoriella hygida]